MHFVLNTYSSKIEPIKIHHLRPGTYKVMNKDLLRIAACVYLCECAQLRIRTKHKVNHSACPLDLACAPIASFQYTFSRIGLQPLGAHVKKVNEKVISQYAGPFGEDANLRFSVGRANRTHTS